MPIYLILKILHILGAAIWFGAGLALPGDLRRTIERGKPHTDLLGERVNRLNRVISGSGVFTILTGLGLIIDMGGFANVRPAIHAGFGITLVLFMIGIALSLPTWKRIESILEGEGEDFSEARRLAGRFSMIHGIEHLLWLIVLILMVYRW